MKVIVRDDPDSESDEEVGEWSDMDNDSLCQSLVDMAKVWGDDPCDEDWLPPQLRAKTCLFPAISQ